MIFDGKKTAEDILLNLKSKVSKYNLDINIAAILVGDDKASEIYTRLKHEAASKIGINYKIIKLNENISINNLKQEILKLNNDKNITGILIQIPLPENLALHSNELVSLIDKTKDIDGLREDSLYLPATVKAISKIIDFAIKNKKLNENSTIAIVGANGFIGKNTSRLIKNEYNFKLINLDINDDLNKLKTADCIISATGKLNLIKSEYIKNDVILVDVGAPKAEFEESCYKKAALYTPVPGGVGPMTVACLMENATEAVEKS